MDARNRGCNGREGRRRTVDGQRKNGNWKSKNVSDIKTGTYVAL